MPSDAPSSWLRTPSAHTSRIGVLATTECVILGARLGVNMPRARVMNGVAEGDVIDMLYIRFADRAK